MTSQLQFKTHLLQEGEVMSRVIQCIQLTAAMDGKERTESLNRS